jgi:hypothetical protein
MKPNANGTAPDPVREPATRGTRRKPASRAGTRGRTIMSIIVVCMAMALVLAAGIFFRRELPTVSAQSGTPALTKKANGPTTVGTIRLARDGDSCREVTIDNSTGRLSENRWVDCNEGKTSSEPREMTKRLEAIRDAFSGREP